MNKMKRNMMCAACAAFLVPLGIVLALVHGPSAGARQNVPRQDNCEDADNRLLSLLDDCVQERFKDIDKGFGYRRIIRVGDTPHRFKPENARELKVVDDLKKAGLNVVLYLAGRAVLGENPPAAERLMYSRTLIKGPASVTPFGQKDEDLPAPAQLLDQSRTAMLRFQAAGENYKFGAGKWRFSARPVRATEQSCLDCHNGGLTPSPGLLHLRGELPGKQETTSLKLGDPLGVVLYAYERKPN